MLVASTYRYKLQLTRLRGRWKPGAASLTHDTSQMISITQPLGYRAKVWEGIDNGYMTGRRAKRWLRSMCLGLCVVAPAKRCAGGLLVG
jgi:hypothetical protein